MYERIFVKTFDSIFKNFNNLFQKLLIPIFFVTFLDFYLSNFFLPQFIINTKNRIFELDQILLLLFIGFILMMLNISIAVTVHRIAILGNDSVSKYGSFILDKRDFKFLFKSMLLVLIFIIPNAIISLIPVVGVFLSFIFTVMLVSRLSLVFPALSCDEEISFKESWNLTKDYKLLTFVMLVLFPVIFSISVSFVYSLLIAFLTNVISEYFSIFYSFLNIFIMIFIVSLLSNLYIEIKSKKIDSLESKKRVTIDKTTKFSDDGVHKILINNSHEITFDSLKEELLKQYEKVNFSEIVFDRDNSWILKNPDDDESYVSLRFDNQFYTVHTKNCVIPVLNSVLV